MNIIKSSFLHEENALQLINKNYQKKITIKHLSYIIKRRIDKIFNTFFVILLLIYINNIPNSFSKVAKLNKLSFTEEINMIVKSTNENAIISILNQNFQAEYQIQINGDSKEYTNNNVYIFNKGEYNIKLTFDSKVNNCEDMFYDCKYTLYIDLSKFDTSQCTNMNNMFNGCTKLSSINLKNFKTSSVTQMKNLFNKCSKLTTIDLSSFDTSSVQDMSSMFSGCSQLKLIDFSKFKTSSATTFNSMFSSCGQLRTLNLSNFDTSKVTDLDNMFYSCSRLISLDLSNWITTNVKTMVSTFGQCSRLVSLNLHSFDFGQVTGISNTFFSINKKLIYCFNIEDNNLNKDTYQQWTLQITIQPQCQNNCFNNLENKFVIYSTEPGLCIEECNFENYNYEYYKECLQSCPKNTMKSLTNEYLCVDIIQCAHFYNYDQTQCIDELVDGYYIYDNVKKIVEKCDVKCKKCNLESVQKDSCIECNIEEQYYEIYDNTNNKYVDCSNILPEGYFFENNKYIPCYKNCLKCNGIGDDNDNKCIECVSNYILIENNCYIKCTYLYYFDDKNNYICTVSDQCPDNYRLIKNKEKCIDNCSNDDKYIYEYNNECIEICPPGYHYNNNNKCINDLVCQNYYNYDHTGCIDEVPEGFYCNDTSQKTIDKCDIKCKKCSLESTQNKLCDSCNNDEGYFQKYKDNQNINNFINCYKDIPEGYYIDNNIYMPCYKTCKTCDETGTITNHKCTSCYSNFTFNNGNCYEICQYYYYFDETKEYHCTVDDKCPNEYNKLIIDKNECVENCLDEYKYDFNNKCYKSCPEGTYYNYDHTNCIESIPKGYYCNNTNEKTINKCENKCERCDLISTHNKLCISCNNNENYYQKENDNLNKDDYINCYNNEIDGYYLDNLNKIYKQCYKSCKSCIKEGSVQNHECTACYSNSTLNNSNCYEICPFYYYFDDKKEYHCTMDDNCPNEYPKRINGQNLCIANCYNDDYYKFEYNNCCYNSCPKGTKKKENSNLCEGNLFCEILYNYEHTECLEELPDGFYVNDTLEKTIDKCNIKCKKCSVESNKNNLCILCNIQENYYPKENDILNENGFINCYDNLLDGYYLDISSSIYKPCYKTCKKCNELGNSNNHKCTECFTTSTLNDSNCYEICTNYYYFDSLNEYHCTQKDECPKGYKLIKEKNKCIDDCEKDDEYKYEYNNLCYQTTFKPKCNNDSLFINKITKECLNECNAIDFFNNKCSLRDNNNKDIIIKQIRSDIESGLMSQELINLVDGDKNDFIIKENDILYQITSSNNQKNNDYKDISTILFGDCEDILKRIYNINKNQPLIIFKVDYYKQKSFIPIIGYEFYHPNNNSKLDLKYCKEELIRINIPFIIDENQLYQYDPNNDFYLDDCYPYTTEHGTDILLKDRIDKYNKNKIAVCENNCAFKNYLTDVKKSVCICKIKFEEINILQFDNQSNILLHNYTIDEGFASSLLTMKCYYTLFSSVGLTKNIAFYLFLFIFIYTIISVVLFYKIGYKSLIKIIENILIEKEKNLKVDNENINPKEKNDNYVYEKLSRNISNRVRISTPKTKKSSNSTHKDLISKEDINSLNNYSNNQKSISKIDFKHMNEIIYSKKKTIIKNNNKVNEKDSINYNYNDYEFNSLSYEKAFNNDKRTYFQYYISLIKTKHPLIFSFYNIKDYNSIIIKTYLFVLFFWIYYFINGLFITKSTIHQLYVEEGNYNFKYFIKFILYSFLIAHCINIIIKYLVLSENNILDIKKEDHIKNAKEKAIKVKKNLIIKYIIFFSLSCSFVLFNGYYLSCFGAVYQNTQIVLIKNTSISLCVSFIYPFIINFLPGLFRKFSLMKDERQCLYNFSKIISVI